MVEGGGRAREQHVEKNQEEGAQYRILWGVPYKWGSEPETSREVHKDRMSDMGFQETGRKITQP